MHTACPVCASRVTLRLTPTEAQQQASILKAAATGLPSGDWVARSEGTKRGCDGYTY